MPHFVFFYLMNIKRLTWDTTDVFLCFTEINVYSWWTKKKLIPRFWPNGGALWATGPAGGTSLIQAAAIGSCDFINTSKWNTPAQNRRRHRGRDTDRQGDTDRNRERQVVRLPERIICRSRTALIHFHWIPTEINEGETLVSEIISEIRHGSQPECKV